MKEKKRFPNYTLHSLAWTVGYWDGRERDMEDDRFVSKDSGDSTHLWPRARKKRSLIYEPIDFAENSGTNRSKFLRVGIQNLAHPIDERKRLEFPNACRYFKRCNQYCESASTGASMSMNDV